MCSKSSISRELSQQVGLGFVHQDATKKYFQAYDAAYLQHHVNQLELAHVYACRDWTKKPPPSNVFYTCGMVCLCRTMMSRMSSRKRQAILKYATPGRVVSQTRFWHFLLCQFRIFFGEFSHMHMCALWSDRSHFDYTKVLSVEISSIVHGLQHPVPVFTSL